MLGVPIDGPSVPVPASPAPPQAALLRRPVSERAPIY
jgi:hypothetical protein